MPILSVFLTTLSTISVGSLPPFGLRLYGGKAPDSPATRSQVVVHNEGSGIHGIMVNDTASAIQWGEGLYARYRKEATDRTAALLDETNDDGRAVGSDGGFPTVGRSLPVTLHREGFREIDRSYFRDEPVADPTTAWRSGLTLAEIHIGFAVPRPRSRGRSTVSTDSDETIEAVLTSKLSSGGNCLVVGPPGSGKSTVCKAVVCEWYEANRGTVLYRERSGREPLSAVDALVRAATARAGHTLVVVEDATRPGANAVFEALDRLGDRNDVSFLLDARESEWAENPSRPGTDTDLEIVHVPPVDENFCEQLIAHFERTTDRTVDVTASSLWSAVREEQCHDEGSSHELLGLIHRLHGRRPGARNDCGD